jgi:hypothetical protein
MWSGFQAAFGGYGCPSSFNGESIYPFEVSGVRAEFFAKRDNLKFGKKRWRL